MKKPVIAAGVAVIIVVIAVGMAIARGIGGGGEHEAHDSDLSLSDPTMTDPVSAASIAMAGLMTWDPANMDSPQAAAAMISDRFTGVMKQYAESGEPDPVLPKHWQSWAMLHDIVHAVAIRDIDRPLSVEKTQAIVPLEVAQTVWHSSGLKTPMKKFDTIVELEQIDGQWLVSNWRRTTA